MRYLKKKSNALKIEKKIFMSVQKISQSIGKDIHKNDAFWKMKNHYFYFEKTRLLKLCVLFLARNCDPTSVKKNYVKSNKNIKKRATICKDRPYTIYVMKKKRF